MIIDLILDRKDGQTYNARDFYFSVMGYREDVPEAADAITRAMDADDESWTRYAICAYIVMNGYPAELCAWVNGRRWLD